MDDGTLPPPKPPVRSCPVCRKRLQEVRGPYRPFCSARCRQVDLGRWLAGDYSIPGDPHPGEEEER